MKGYGVIIAVVASLVTSLLADSFGVSFVDFKPQLIFTALGVLFVSGLVGAGLEWIFDMTGFVRVEEGGNSD